MKSINQTRHSMREDSMFLMFDGESSDESDDSYDAEDENDVDCNIYQELYSTSFSSHDFYCSTCIFCTIIPCYIASHQRASCLSY